MGALEAEFPERFGPFLLLRQLGVGGMGTAYLAMHGESERLLVVKRMHPELLADASIFKRFVHEAEVASHVQHPNVAQLMAMGRVDAREPFLATEYVFGIQLSQIVERVEHAQIDPVPLRIAVHLALELARGVEAIHAACHRETGEPLSLIHRDIGARNVLVGFDGRVRIIDLGLGKSVLSDWQTAAQVLAGSPDYMPPEQALGARVDGRADVYSAAVTAWELIAGRKRIREDSVAARLSRAVQAQPEPLLVHRPEASKRLEVILAQAMHPDPNLRTPRAELFRRALAEEERALGGSVKEEEVVAWLDAACATVIAKEKRILADVRARGFEHAGHAPPAAAPAPGPAKTELFVGRAAVLESPKERDTYDFYADPERTLPPRARSDAARAHGEDAARSAGKRAGVRASVEKLAESDSVAAIASLVDPDTFKAQPPIVRVLLALGAMGVLVLVATVTAILFRPTEVVVSTPLPVDPAPAVVLDAGVAAAVPAAALAPDAGLAASEDAGVDEASAKPADAEPARLTPELAARKAELVRRIRQLRRVRFDVSFQRRLTELSSRLSRVRSAKALDEIEGAIIRLERES